MGVQRVEDLQAYQLAREFKLEVYRLLERNLNTRRSYSYVDQLCDALSSGEGNIAEGFGRWHASEMRQFLRYAIGSLEEALRRLRDGIDRGYFTEADCAHALALGERAVKCTTALWKSLAPFAGGHRPPKRRRRRNTRRRHHGGEP
jgi:four helix bundle protein